MESNDPVGMNHKNENSTDCNKQQYWPGRLRKHIAIGLDRLFVEHPNWDATLDLHSATLSKPARYYRLQL
jgi:hypothetical protein